MIMYSSDMVAFVSSISYNIAPKSKTVIRYNGKVITQTRFIKQWYV